jgi:hypothetical protein
MTRPRMASVAMSWANETIDAAEAISAVPARNINRQESGNQRESAKPAVMKPRATRMNRVRRPCPFIFSEVATNNAPQIEPAPEQTSRSV